jgi:hypothetical protein
VVVAAAAAMMTWKLTRTSCELPLLLLLSSVVVCSVQCRAGGRRTHTRVWILVGGMDGWIWENTQRLVVRARTVSIQSRAASATLLRHYRRPLLCLQRCSIGPLLPASGCSAIHSTQV